MKDINVQQTFLKQLQAFYGAETHISATLPKMITVAGSVELKDTLNNHLKMTRAQVSRLEKVFENLHQTPSGPPSSVVVEQLQDEGIFGPSGSGYLHSDADVILIARKIHHFEMNQYGSLVTLAGELENKNVEALLTDTQPHAPLSGAENR